MPDVSVVQRQTPLDVLNCPVLLESPPHDRELSLCTTSPQAQHPPQVWAGLVGRHIHDGGETELGRGVVRRRHREIEREREREREEKKERERERERERKGEKEGEREREREREREKRKRERERERGDLLGS